MPAGRSAPTAAAGARSIAARVALPGDLLGTAVPVNAGGDTKAGWAVAAPRHVASSAPARRRALPVRRPRPTTRRRSRADGQTRPVLAAERLESDHGVECRSEARSSSLHERVFARIAPCLSRHGNSTPAALISSGMRYWQEFPFMRRSGRTTTSRTLASRCSSCLPFWPRTCPPLRGDLLMARRRRSWPFASGWRDG